MSDIRRVSLWAGAGIGVAGMLIFLKIQGLSFLGMVPRGRLPFAAVPFLMMQGAMGLMIGLVGAGVVYSVCLLVTRARD